jgi:hypothetical protein
MDKVKVLVKPEKEVGQHEVGAYAEADCTGIGNFSVNVNCGGILNFSAAPDDEEDILF